MKPTIILQSDEKMLFETQPEKIYIYYHSFKNIIKIFLLCLALFLYLVYKKNTITLDVSHLNLIIIGGFFVLMFLMFLASLIWSNYAYKRIWYFLTDQRCIIYSGVLNLNKEMHPYNRIVDIDLHQSLLQSWFNLAAIRFSDQGGGGFSVGLMPGLSHSKAEKIYQIMNEHMMKK